MKRRALIFAVVCVSLAFSVALLPASAASPASTIGIFLKFKVPDTPPGTTDTSSPKFTPKSSSPG